MKVTKKKKFLTRNYILMLLLNCIYGVSQNFGYHTSGQARRRNRPETHDHNWQTIASAVTIIAMICRPILVISWTESILKRFCIWLLGCLLSTSP